MRIHPTLGFYRRAGVHVPIGVHSDIDYSKINSKDILNFVGGRFLQVADDVQVKDAVVEDKVNFSLPEWEVAALVLSADKWNGLTSPNGPDTNTVPRFEPKDSFVIRNGPERTEVTLGVPIRLVGICHLGDASNDNLSGQVKHTSNSVICQPVECILPKYLMFPSSGAYIVTRAVRLFESFPKKLILFGGWKKLQVDRYLHNFIVIHEGKDVKYGKEGSRYSSVG
jgi:hypothetical protein